MHRCLNQSSPRKNKFAAVPSYAGSDAGKNIAFFWKYVPGSVYLLNRSVMSAVPEPDFLAGISDLFFTTGLPTPNPFAAGTTNTSSLGLGNRRGHSRRHMRPVGTDAERKHACVVANIDSIVDRPAADVCW